MKAIISNDKYGKSVVFENVIDEGESFDLYSFINMYKIKVVLDSNTGNTIPELYNKLAFTIDKIEIYDTIKNENDEFEEVLLRSITDRHSLYGINIKLEQLNDPIDAQYSSEMGGRSLVATIIFY